MIVVTGASDNHHRSLIQFIQSFVRFEKNSSKLLVYDLGLTVTNRRKVFSICQQKLSNFQLIVFDYAKYPRYVNITKNAGEYAWKSIIYHQVMESHKGEWIFWIDAGCMLTQSLDAERKWIQEVGWYSPWSSGCLQDWCHEGTLRRLGVAQHLWRARNLSGGVLAIDSSRPILREIICRWRNLSVQKETIAPPGSSRKNHRQDQSLLTILMNQAIDKKKLKSSCPSLLSLSLHHDCG